MEDNQYNFREQTKILMQIKVYTAVVKEKVCNHKYKRVKYKKHQW